MLFGPGQVDEDEKAWLNVPANEGGDGIQSFGDLFVHDTLGAVNAHSLHPCCFLNAICAARGRSPARVPHSRSVPSGTAGRCDRRSISKLPIHHGVRDRTILPSERPLGASGLLDTWWARQSAAPSLRGSVLAEDPERWAELHIQYAARIGLVVAVEVKDQSILKYYSYVQFRYD